MTILKKDLVALALDVTDMTMERWNLLLEVMKSDSQMNLMMKREWNSKPRDSEEAIREYYRSSDIWFVNSFLNGYGALLALAEGAPGAQSGWCRRLVELIGAGGGRVLDYGGAFFRETWPLVAAGYRVDVAEVRGPVTAFLKRFIGIANLGANVGVVEVDSETPIVDTYDGIACFETLEHVLHPALLVGHLHKHLRSGGAFAFSVTFGAPEHAPYHVASNAPLSDWSVWSGIMAKVGFFPCWEDPDGSSVKIWRSGP